MFKRLLIPLDGSHLAEAILPAAVVLAGRLGAAVTLLHVLERNAPAQVHGDRHLGSGAEAEAYLDETAGRLRQAGLSVAWHAHEAAVGDVAQSITRHAAEMGADLVLLATHGAGGMRQFVFGSIAQQVIGYGTTPVFLLHPEATPPSFQCRRFVVPLEGAAEHESSLPVASALAEAVGAAVDLVTVVPYLSNLGGTRAAVGRLLPTATRALLDVQEQEAADYLAVQARRLGAPGGVACQVERGDPVEKVLRHLEQVDADLLILATHAHRGWTAFWSGSVSPGLISRWRRPTLLVRAGTQ